MSVKIGEVIGQKMLLYSKGYLYRNMQKQSDFACCFVGFRFVIVTFEEKHDEITKI